MIYVALQRWFVSHDGIPIYPPVTHYISLINEMFQYSEACARRGRGVEITNPLRMIVISSPLAELHRLMRNSHTRVGAIRTNVSSKSGDSTHSATANLARGKPCRSQHTERDSN